MRIYKLSGIILFTLLITTTVALGQKNVKGSGYILTQQRETSDFTNIEVSQGINIAIVQGKLQPLTIEADDNLFLYIKTTVRNNTLKIYIPDTIHIIKYAAMNVLISVPEISNLKACNNSHIDASSQIWEIKTLALEAITGGYISIHLKASDIQAEARTSGIIALKGEAQNLKATIKTAARLDARELDAENADLQLSTGARAEVQVNKIITYDLCGHSRLILRGSPLVKQSQICSGSKVFKEK